MFLVLPAKLNQRVRVSNSSQECSEKDWCRGKTTFFFGWVIPIIFFATGFLGHPGLHLFTSALTNVLWITALFWVGMACTINGAKCGRSHCRYMGPFSLLAGVVAALLAFGVIHLSWGIFWPIYGVGVLISFLPEFMGKKYIRPRKPS